MKILIALGVLIACASAEPSLGGLLGGDDGEGGLLGLNLSGTLGSILGKTDDPQ